MKWKEASARSGENVEKIFYELSKEVLDRVVGKGDSQKLLPIAPTQKKITKPKYKVILLGVMGSGKSCFIQRFVNNKFIQVRNTLSPELIPVNYPNCILQVWDTGN